MKLTSLTELKSQILIVLSVFFMGAFPFLSKSQTLAYTNTTWKAFRTSSTPPTGWNVFSFNDASWSQAMQVSQASCLTPYGQTPGTSSACGDLASPGVLPIWAYRSSGCSIENDVVYLRGKFTAPPANSPCGYHLFVKADDASEIYVNGNIIGWTSGNWNSGTYFNINQSYIVWNSNQNVIAVKATDVGTTGWFSAHLCKVCD